MLSYLLSHLRSKQSSQRAERKPRRLQMPESLAMPRVICWRSGKQPPRTR